MKRNYLLSFSVIITLINHSNAIDLYVSPDGHDTNNGKTLSTPFQSIKKAQEEARKWDEVTVHLRGGIYFLEEPLVFTHEDSGTEDHPVIYSAYQDEKPVLSGGMIINTPFEEVKPGLYQTKIDNVANGHWYFYQLFTNGNRLTRARTPNEGFFEMVGEMRLEGPAHFTFKENNIKKEWAERGDVDIIGLAKWAEIRMPLVSVNEEEHTATLTKQVPPSNWRGENPPRYWIENAPEALDQPGEWRLDKAAGTLSIMLEKGQNPNEMQIIAPRLEQLIRIEGNVEQKQFVNHLQFKGLTFSHTLSPKLQEGYPDVQAAYDISAAVSANGAQNCRIEGCQFTLLGNYGVSFTQGCRGNQIVGNEINDVGAGGIKIGEPAMREGALRTHDNNITDNHIHHIGVIYPAAVGIWVGQSDSNLLAHNHIHHTYYTGISVGWTWGYTPTGAHHNTIEYNLVHDIGQGVLSDMGGIYTLGTQPGTVIRNNIFHHIDSHTYGGWGIYPDEGSTQILIENNITYRTKSAGFHQHYGKENIIRNNIFAFAKEYQVMRTRAEDHLSLTFERNIVIFDSGELLGSNWTGENFKLDYNLYWDTRAKEFRFKDWSWDEWQAKGQDVHSIIADPLFENAAKYDFRLKEDSPAFKLGFNPIDISKVGIRK